MAELLKAIGTSRLRARLKDGTAITPNSYEFYLTAVPQLMMTLPRDKQVLLGQRGGTNMLFALINNGISGPGTLTLQFAFVDPINTTDVTIANWIQQLHKGPSYSAPFGSYVDTNSLPLGASEDIAAVIEIIYENSGAAGADVGWSSDVQVLSISPNEEKNGAIAWSVTFNVNEEWTKAVAA